MVFWRKLKHIKHTKLERSFCLYSILYAFFMCYFHYCCVLYQFRLRLLLRVKASYLWQVNFIEFYWIINSSGRQGFFVITGSLQKAKRDKRERKLRFCSVINCLWSKFMTDFSNDEGGGSVISLWEKLKPKALKIFHISTKLFLERTKDPKAL